MQKLNAICREVVEQTADAVACGVVDLKTGTLGMHHVLPRLDKRDFDRVGRAVRQMFQRNELRILEFRLTDGTVPSRASEIFVESPLAFYFMKSVSEKSLVFLLMTTAEANKGLCWITLRRAVASYQHAEGLPFTQPIAPGAVAIATPPPRLPTERTPLPRSARTPLPVRPPARTPPRTPLPKAPRSRTERAESAEEREKPNPSRISHGGATLTERNPAIRRTFPTLGVPNEEGEAAPDEAED